VDETTFDLLTRDQMDTGAENRFFYV